MPRSLVLLAALLSCAHRQTPEQERADRLLADGRGNLQKGLPHEALPLFQQAVKVRETELGPKHPDTLAALVQLGYAYLDADEPKKARELFERTLIERERMSKKPTAEAAESLCAAAAAALASREPATARPFAERGTRMYAQSAGPESPELARCQIDLGAILAELGDPRGARLALEQAAILLEKKSEGGRDARYSPDLARALERLAALDQRVGDLVKARAARERALEMLTRAVGPDHPRVADLSLQVGGMYADAGDVAQARESLERAVQIREVKLGNKSVKTAEARAAFGDFLAHQGDRVKARAQLNQAITTLEEKLGATHDKVSAARAQLAHMVAEGGDLATATLLYDQVIKDETASLGPQHATLASRYVALAEVKRKGAQPDEAIALLRKALAIDRKIAVRGEDTARDLELLGLALLDQGRFQDAKAQLEQGLSIRERLFGPDHVKVASVMSGLAQAEAALGNPGGAEAHLYRAQAIEARAMTYLRALPAIGRRSRVFAGFASAEASLAVARGYSRDVPARLGLYTSARWKNAQLDLLAADRTTQAAANSAPVRQQLAELARVRAELAEIVTSQKQPDPSRLKDLKKLRAEESKLVTRIGEDRLRRWGDPVDDPTQEALCGALPRDGVLVDYAITEGHLTAAVLRQRACQVTLVDLGQLEPIKAAVKAFRKRIEEDAGDLQKPGATLAGREAAVYFQQRRLRQLLLQPLVKAIGEVSTLYVSPVGPLRAVPFGLLAGSRKRYLVEDIPVVHLSASRDLLRPAQTPGRDVLVIGDVDPSAKAGGETAPEWPAVAACGKLAGASWPPLAEAKRETTEIAKIYDKAGLLRVGADATEANLRKLASGKRAIQVSAAAYFVSEKCAPPSADRSNPDPDAEGEVLKTNPLLQAGLVLVGAGGPSAVTDDGYATALELSGLDLRGVDLFVISGSDTGETETERGLALAALERAPLLAGAQRVMLSMFTVSAPESAQVTVSLHEAYAAGLAAGPALRRAQLTALANLRKRGRAHPLYWANLVQVGD